MKIAIAMSGGIDSTIAALLLQQQGHTIVGITAKMFSINTGNQSEQDSHHIQDAKRIADRFSFEHHVVDITDAFSESVIKPFCNEYLSGRTPNPCIMCNPSIKFNKLLHHTEMFGCDKLATGHYAQVKRYNNNRYCISSAVDQSRDQSYFLAMLPQHFLKKILFPLGNVTKNQIREMAREKNIHIANKPDSQEICFIPDNDYANFITQTAGSVPPSGDIVNSEGKILGSHKGIHRYTIGQRRGLGISAPKPLYVIGVDAEKNQIIAGYKEELQRSKLLAKHINYMKLTELDNMQAIVKCRSTQPGSPASLKETNQGIEVHFNDPQYGISPGQAAVFYDIEMDIIGAGIIEQSYI